MITSLVLIAFILLFILTSYKNIRFSFRGSVKEAYTAILFWPLLGILTLGILFPLARVKLKRFVVDNTRYGTENFDFAGTYSDYGKLLLLFAKVRLTNYLAELAELAEHLVLRIVLRMNGSLDDFTAVEGEKVSALGQEMGSAFDFDLGIGI